MSAFWARFRRRFRPPRRLSFTREGRIIVILAVGVGFAAINTGNNLLYLLLGWMLSFIIASGILSEATIRQLTVERRPPPRIFAGEPFLMEVVIKNSKEKRASYSIEVEDLQGKVSASPGSARARSGVEDGRVVPVEDGRVVPIDKRCYFLKIPEKKSQRTSYRHTFAKRGLYKLTGYRLATKFPFALFRKSKDVDAPLEMIVYPARVAVPRPPPRAATRGDAVAAKLGRRGEFFGLREHRTGDDRRDVHWKSSARSGRLLVREYEDELARRVVIGVDNALPASVREAIEDGALTPAQDAQVTAVERGISIAASLAATYLELGWTVELVARGLQVPGGTGRMHEAKLAKALALLPYTGDDVAFPALPRRVESVFVQPRGVPAEGRPTAQTVMEA